MLGWGVIRGPGRRTHEFIELLRVVYFLKLINYMNKKKKTYGYSQQTAKRKPPSIDTKSNVPCQLSLYKQKQKQTHNLYLY